MSEKVNWRGILKDVDAQNTQADSDSFYMKAIEALGKPPNRDCVLAWVKTTDRRDSTLKDNEAYATEVKSMASFLTYSGADYQLAWVKATDVAPVESNEECFHLLLFETLMSRGKDAEAEYPCLYIPTRGIDELALGKIVNALIARRVYPSVISDIFQPVLAIYPSRMETVRCFVNILKAHYPPNFKLIVTAGYVQMDEIREVTAIREYALIY